MECNKWACSSMALSQARGVRFRVQVSPLSIHHQSPKQEKIMIEQWKNRIGSISIIDSIGICINFNGHVDGSNLNSILTF